MVGESISNIADLKPDSKNARKHTPRNLGMIADALHEVGAARSIVIDEDGNILAGNGVVEAAADAGIERVRVVDADGETIIAVRRKGLSDEQKKRLAFFDNRAGELSEWDGAQIAQEIEAGLDLGGLFTDKELSDILERAAGDLLDATEDPPDLERWQVPDAVFPSNNEWGVPLLDANMQATALIAPFVPWGAHGSRKTRMTGTYHFYTTDDRFQALWDDPSGVINSRCQAVVEPNFSQYTEMPLAVGLWGVYRKRWLARFWQGFGVRVFADLNVAVPHREINLLGIPKGWRAWATRGYTARIDQTDEEYEIACEHAGTRDILFVVYGGGKQVKEHCLSRGWLWFMEDRDRAKVKDGKE